MSPANFTPNTNIILACLRKAGKGLTRADIMIKTGLPRTTIYDSLVLLKDQGYIQSSSRSISKRRGRPTVYWKYISSE